MSTPPLGVNPPPLGSIEPHAGLLTQPFEDQLLYKIMTVENLFWTIDGAYLQFNRVDSYGDGPGADPHDGAQLPTDQPGNAGTGFAKAPEFTAAHYYDRSRSRTYACCFGLENADYLWHTYGNGGAQGKIGLELAFGPLRAHLNAFMASEGVRIEQGGVIYHQIFDINYGIVRYVDWDNHQANTERLRGTDLPGIHYGNLAETVQSAARNMDVATDSKAFRPRVREASRSRASDSPSPGEDMDIRTTRPDGELLLRKCVRDRYIVGLKWGER